MDKNRYTSAGDRFARFDHLREYVESLKGRGVSIEECFSTLEEMKDRLWTAAVTRASRDPAFNTHKVTLPVWPQHHNDFGDIARTYVREQESMLQTALDQLRREDPELGAIALTLTCLGIRGICGEVTATIDDITLPPMEIALMLVPEETLDL